MPYVTQVEAPVLIDEWQLEPEVWDRVRKAVDDDARGGQFLLAGSAGVAPGVRIHSGADRIVSLALRRSRSPSAESPSRRRPWQSC
ncbi:MAG: hypothetical protein ACRDQA_11100 [Nocardioidaceae bacterium]